MKPDPIADLRTSNDADAPVGFLGRTPVLAPYYAHDRDFICVGVY